MCCEQCFGTPFWPYRTTSWSKFFGRNSEFVSTSDITRIRETLATVFAANGLATISNTMARSWPTSFAAAFGLHNVFWPMALAAGWTKAFYNGFPMLLQFDPKRGSGSRR